MAINKEDVEYIAKLARLSLEEEEKEVYLKQIASVLGYMDKLDELDTEGVESTVRVVPVEEDAFREDRIEPSIEHKKLLENGPDVNEEFFKVPKII